MGVLAEKLLVEMFTATGMKVPGWVKLRYEGNMYEDLREVIKWYLVKRINEEYAKFVGKVVGMGTRANIYSRFEVGFEEKVRKVLKEKLLPWAFLHRKYVYFSGGLTSELRSVVGDVGGLKLYRSY